MLSKILPGDSAEPRAARPRYPWQFPRPAQGIARFPIHKLPGPTPVPMFLPSMVSVIHGKLLFKNIKQEVSEINNLQVLDFVPSSSVAS